MFVAMFTSNSSHLSLINETFTLCTNNLFEKSYMAKFVPHTKDECVLEDRNSLCQTPSTSKLQV